MPNQQKKHRGFAAMDQEKQREIASKGGKAAHEKGTAHEFTPEEAREAGRKGGETVSQNREHMAAIGRIRLFLLRELLQALAWAAPAPL